MKNHESAFFFSNQTERKEKAFSVCLIPNSLKIQIKKVRRTFSAFFSESAADFFVFRFSFFSSRIPRRFR